MLYRDNIVTMGLSHLSLKTFVYDILAYFGIKEKRQKEYYVSKFSKSAPWVYISYITAPFYMKNLSSHQNLRETIAMVNVLNDLGLNVYVQEYQSRADLPSLSNVKMVFGHEPNLIKAAEKYPEALVIQYNTGAHIDHANSQIVKMTDYVNKKYHANLPYRRLIDTKDTQHSIYRGYEIADKILQIGSKFTIETMPEKYRDKIVLIHQSTQVTRDILVEDAAENEFLFLGSGGNMLKGIPLLLEYFAEHQDCVIHIVGPIEEDYQELIQNEVTSNIHFHGFMDVNSDEFTKIAVRCNYIVYPSGTEGMPGAVLCAMQYGLIPIVTPWSAFDEIKDYGYLMDYNWNVHSLEKGIDWALSLSPQERLLRKKRCSKFVIDNYNLDKFSEEFRVFCKSILFT